MFFNHSINESEKKTRMHFIANTITIENMVQSCIIKIEIEILA